MKRRAIDRLVNWMGNTTKKPLFIFGARRVGKTYLVKDFGKEYFKDVMYVNCESNVFANDVFNENVTFEMILRKLELIFNKSVNKVDTLIVFDEIESSLDVANVERFAKYVKEFTDKSQFLIITHRPGTMEQCDVLYGVTMQNRGISQMLKVKLVDAIEMAEPEEDTGAQA